jgi:hypothetical protein
MSMQCDGKFYQQRQPYFVTFDLAANHFVYERVGGNILPGEIIAANDERLDLSLKASGGRILLSFDRKGNFMTWPGMPAAELWKPLLRHACTAVSDRTMLSMFYQPEQSDPKRRDAVDAFSLTCPGNTGKYFVTLDRATKAVVLETEHASGILPGNITGIDDGVIRFTIARGPEQYDLLWDERSRSLTWVAVANNPARPTKVHECIVTTPRSIMEFYGELSRWR